MRSSCLLFLAFACGVALAVPVDNNVPEPHSDSETHELLRSRCPRGYLPCVLEHFLKCCPEKKCICPDRYIYNPDLNRCFFEGFELEESDSSFKNDNHDAPMCRVGYVPCRQFPFRCCPLPACFCAFGFFYDADIDLCVPEIPECPPGHYYDEELKECLPFPTCPQGYFFNETLKECCLHPICPKGYFFNETLKECCLHPICPKGYFFNETLKECCLHPICPPGYFFDETLKECCLHPTCPQGYFFDEKLKECCLIFYDHQPAPAVHQPAPAVHQPASSDVHPPASSDVHPPASSDVHPPASSDVQPPFFTVNRPEVHPPCHPEEECVCAEGFFYDPDLRECLPYPRLPVCPRDKNGLFIASENPHKFYRCAWGVPKLFKCPDRLVFNLEEEVCDWPL